MSRPSSSNTPTFTTIKGRKTLYIQEYLQPQNRLKSVKHNTEVQKETVPFDVPQQVTPFTSMKSAFKHIKTFFFFATNLGENKQISQESFSGYPNIILNKMRAWKKNFDLVCFDPLSMTQQKKVNRVDTWLSNIYEVRVVLDLGLIEALHDGQPVDSPLALQ